MTRILGTLYDWTILFATPMNIARRARGRVLVLGIILALLVIGLVTGSPPTPTVERPHRPVAMAMTMESQPLLEIKGRAPKTGYSRAQFGETWYDVDRNGIDTRNDILVRDLVGETFKPRTHNRVVLTGTLHDPYTGKTIKFVRGANSRAVEIDHVVSLSNAWQTGAARWSPEKRRAFANDPLNLLAVDGPTNQRKGAGDAATWLPPNKSFRPEFASRQLQVKIKYGLWATQAEYAAMRQAMGFRPI